ncbi:uncharacterized protein A4U43_C05F26230 [Asparagus officinalis]|uniref:RCD1 WWE domain-containing protein n=1 Tax=Asparagus officinalis TaxID=4686 RepID=A0A5P1EZZ9_ASPOF|nr:uncharacterized protein A4U43_C05F26230 [Asparagus officinalis]
MDPNNSSSSSVAAAIDLLLQARMLLEIILHPTSCLAVLQNWQSFYNTRTPEKLMLFTSTGWVDLPSKNAEEIKKCFEHRCLATKIEIGGFEVVVNLIGMILIDSCSRMTSISWIDTEGKSFFPKKIYGGGRVRSLAPQVLEEAGRVSFGSLLDLRRLEESNDEYKTVKQTFMKGMRLRDHRETAEVTAVYSCTHASRFGANWRWAFGRIARSVLLYTCI